MLQGPQNPAQLLQKERLLWPGMLPAEILIFQNWLKIYGANYDKIEGNVRIGAGHDPGPSFADYIRKDAMMSTKLRIDAVAYQGAKPTLIEVKRRAGASALGQLLTYEAVWIEDFPATAKPALLLITDQLQPNILPLIKKAGIALAVVKTDFSVLSPKMYAPGYQTR